MIRVFSLVDGFTFLALTFVWVYGFYALGMLAASKLLRSGDDDVKIGVGPQLVAFSLGGTHYKLCLVPLGAEVRADLTSPWRVVAFKLAGPATLFLAALLFVFVFLLTGVRLPQRPGAYVRFAVNRQDEAGQDLLKEGDLIVRVGDHEVQDGLDLARELTRWQSGPLPLEIERDGTRRVVALERSPADAPEKHVLDFRSITELEYPGIWAALTRTPRSVLDLSVFQFRGYFIKDEHLGETVGSHVAYFLDFFIGMWVFLAAAVLVLLLVEDGGFALAALILRDRVAGGNLRATTGCLGWVLVGAWLVFVFRYSDMFAGSLFDSPFLTQAFRDFPANVYWQVTF
jgi:hypothetical protein